MKKSAVVLILVLAVMLGACGKVEIDSDNKNNSVNFTGQDFNNDISEDAFENSPDLTQEKLTESVDNPIQTVPDLPEVLETLGMVQVNTAEADKQNQRIADSIIKKYFEFCGKDYSELYSLGKCKPAGIKDSYANYIYVTDIPSAYQPGNIYYSVKPEFGTVFEYILESEAFLVWKDGAPPDEEKAIAFFESVVGDDRDYYFIDVVGDGNYVFELYRDSENWDMIYVNWECDKMFIVYDNGEKVEIYPNDIVGFFD